jgi:hypothetical protein
MLSLAAELHPNYHTARLPQIAHVGLRRPGNIRVFGAKSKSVGTEEFPTAVELVL